MLQVNECTLPQLNCRMRINTENCWNISYGNLFKTIRFFFTFRKARQKIENVPWNLDLCVETVPLSKINNFYGLNIIIVFQSWIQNYQHKIKLYHNLVKKNASKVMLLTPCAFQVVLFFSFFSSFICILDIFIWTSIIYCCITV